MKILISTVLMMIIVIYSSVGSSRRLSSAADSSSAMLTIGDQLPDLKISNIMNYRESEINLSSLKGKLLILDFWSVGCGPCIHAMPKMQALQDKYQDKLQVLMVTENTREEVDRLFNKLEKLENVKLPTVVEDKKLKNMFPFRFLPTHVWISEQGEVLQITDGSNTTDENLEDYFRGKEVSLPYNPANKDFNPDVSLWTEGNGRQMKYLRYYSYIMDFSPDAGMRTGVTKDPETGKFSHIMATNHTILQLCKIAYGWDTASIINPFFYNNRIEMHVSDTGRFTLPKDANWNDWKVNNLYSYELVVPPDKSDRLFDYMRQDISRYFNVNGKIEKRKMECLVLVKSEMENKFATAGGPFNYSTEYGEHLEIKNAPMDFLLQMLQSYFGRLSTPIIDETGYTENIDLIFKTDLHDLEAVKKALAEYGLALVKEERLIDVLVLRERLSAN